jgi:DNA-binding response OmpR family regulator
MVPPLLFRLQVCRKVRQMFPASALPVIMVSAKSQEGDIVEGLKAGANDYMTKVRISTWGRDHGENRHLRARA